MAEVKAEQLPDSAGQTGQAGSEKVGQTENVGPTGSSSENVGLAGQSISENAGGPTGESSSAKVGLAGRANCDGIEEAGRSRPDDGLRAGPVVPPPAADVAPVSLARVSGGLVPSGGHRATLTAGQQLGGVAMATSLVHRKINHVHKLERKHSSGDLHSRLKTRKLLGVGETDDGDVHRSKLSQILGHSEQLYTRLPRGLRLCQYVTAAIFSLSALSALFFPGHVLQCILGEDAPVGSTLMCVRLYGVGLISFTLLFFGTLYSSDKDTIRWSLIASTAFFVLHTFVGVLSAPSAAVSVLWGAAVTVATIVPALPPAYFYWIITSRHHYGNKCAPVGDVSWRK